MNYCHLQTPGPIHGPNMVAVETKHDEAHALHEVTARLVTQFPHVPSDDVQAIVTAAWDEFTGRPIRDFVPVLAERTARQKLASAPSAR